MGCGCGQRSGQAARTQQEITAASRYVPDPSGTLIAAAVAGGEWVLTTQGGTDYAFKSVAEARKAQGAYGGSIKRSAR